VEIRYGERRIGVHVRAAGRHEIVSRPKHHASIPMGSAPSRKTLIHVQAAAPEVEQPPLAVCESCAGATACPAGNAKRSALPRYWSQPATVNGKHSCRS
jgi:hypothetical protein